MRCFIAAWPDEATVERLAQLSADVRGDVANARAIAPANLHLTLAFIGSLSEADAVRVAAACGRLSFAPIVWKVDTIVQFARAGVLAAGGSEPPALVALAARVRQMLDALGVPFDRKPFRPHVTLLRDARQYGGAAIIDPAIHWSIGHVALYRSTSAPGGSIYARVPVSH